MTTMRLSPMAPAPEPGRRRRWTIAASVLLHVLALAALLLGVRRPTDEQSYAPSYELLFQDGGGREQPTSTDRADDGLPRQLPAPETPPVPEQKEAAPAPPPRPEATPGPPTPPQAAPPAPAAPVRPPAPAAPAPPAPTPPAPAPPAPAQVRIEQPAAPAPPLPLDTEPALPAPPVPPPAPPAPRLRPMTPPPPPATGTFAHPMDLNFNPSPSRLPAPRTQARQGSVASRSIDMALGAPKPGPNRNEAFFDLHAANVGADWAQGLKAYWLRHRYYPPQAADNGEDGAVDIELTVNRQGRVVSVAVKARSGSAWLDMAAVGTWRDAQLAPLPLETLGDTIKVPLTIHYILLH